MRDERRETKGVKGEGWIYYLMFLFLFGVLFVVTLTNLQINADL
jgi:hypothetical protein